MLDSCEHEHDSSQRYLNLPEERCQIDRSHFEQKGLELSQLLLFPVCLMRHIIYHVNIVI